MQQPQLVGPRKDEFQRYLEKSGVVDALTKALVALYESNERPGSAVGFVKDFLVVPAGVDVEELQNTISRQAEEIQNLRRQLEELDPK